MGEIADMMIDGTMCQMCGMFIEDGPLGYPGYCSEECKREHLGDDDEPVHLHQKAPRTIECPQEGCERKFRSRDAAAQHWRDKHGEE
jgi:hypothetical protein